MANFATALKEEICRVARREIKAQATPTRQAIVQHRHEILRLKRQLREQQRRVNVLEQKKSKGASGGANDGRLAGLRFSTRSVKRSAAGLGFPPRITAG